MFTRQGQRLIFTYDSEKLWIEPWGRDALRVRATKMANMPTEDWALLSPETTEAEITITPYGASIVNGKIRAELSSAGKINLQSERPAFAGGVCKKRKEYKFQPGVEPTGFASAWI